MPEPLDCLTVARDGGYGTQAGGRMVISYAPTTDRRLALLLRDCLRVGYSLWVGPLFPRTVLFLTALAVFPRLALVGQGSRLHFPECGSRTPAARTSAGSS